MNSTEKWMFNWFKDQYYGDFSFDNEGVIKQNFFETGLIDSLGILSLIDAIESEFGIEFTHDHFEQRRFSTISGLSEIIEEEQNKNGTL